MNLAKYDLHAYAISCLDIACTLVMFDLDVVRPTVCVPKMWKRRFSPWPVLILTCDHIFKLFSLDKVSFDERFRTPLRPSPYHSSFRDNLGGGTSLLPTQSMAFGWDPGQWQDGPILTSGACSASLDVASQLQLHLAQSAQKVTGVAEKLGTADPQTRPRRAVDDAVPPENGNVTFQTTCNPAAIFWRLSSPAFPDRYCKRQILPAAHSGTRQEMVGDKLSRINYRKYKKITVDPFWIREYL